MKAPITLILTALLLGACPPLQAQADQPFFSQAELDQMLAPIALYPDVLLSQVLTAATHPLDIVEASRWLESNPDLKGEDAVLAAEEMPWDPSVKTLTAFPDVVDRMDDNLSWTRRLGEAFLAQEEQVMETIQSLRDRALAEGSLESLDHLAVEQTGETIVIEPAEPEVIYVPYYSTRIVYGDWWWPHYPPICWDPPYYYSYPHYSSVGFYWSSGFRLSTYFHWSSCDWRHRRIVHRPPPVHYRSDYRRHDGYHRPAPPPEHHTRPKPAVTDSGKQQRPHRTDTPGLEPRQRDLSRRESVNRTTTSTRQLEPRTRSDRDTSRYVQSPRMTLTQRTVEQTRVARTNTVPRQLEARTRPDRGTSSVRQPARESQQQPRIRPPSAPVVSTPKPVATPPPPAAAPPRPATRSAPVASSPSPRRSSSQGDDRSHRRYNER